jgi:hypothetical protein
VDDEVAAEHRDTAMHLLDANVILAVHADEVAHRREVVVRRDEAERHRLRLDERDRVLDDAELGVAREHGHIRPVGRLHQASTHHSAPAAARRAVRPDDATATTSDYDRSDDAYDLLHVASGGNATS